MSRALSTLTSTRSAQTIIPITGPGEGLGLILPFAHDARDTRCQRVCTDERRAGPSASSGVARVTGLFDTHHRVLDALDPSIADFREPRSRPGGDAAADA